MDGRPAEIATGKSKHFNRDIPNMILLVILYSF